MAAEVIRSVAQANHAIALMARSNGTTQSRVEPCAKPGLRDTTPMCKYATPRGCGEKAVGGLLSGPDGVLCPIQRGVLQIVGTNGAVKM